jgi:hypothetical protein
MVLRDRVCERWVTARRQDAKAREPGRGGHMSRLHTRTCTRRTRGDGQQSRITRVKNESGEESLS